MLQTHVATQSYFMDIHIHVIKYKYTSTLDNLTQLTERLIWHTINSQNQINYSIQYYDKNLYGIFF